jgi:tetratricopeptide (TPR) repeat protein
MRTILALGMALLLGACAVAPLQPDPGTRERAQASYLRGIALRDKGEHEGAISAFDEVIRLEPRNVEAYTDRGYSRREKELYDLALADFNEAIRLDPSFGRAYINRGYTWYVKQDYDRAIADFDEAMRLDPPHPYYERGNAWYDKGDKDRALADFTEAIRLGPAIVLAYLGRAKVWSDRGEHDRAVADYDEAIRLEPRNALAYYGRGGEWYAKRDFARGVADFYEVIRLDPRHVGAHSGAAWLLATAPDAAVRDGKRAVEMAHRACELTDWSSAYAIQTLSIAHAAAGSFAEAVRWLEEALTFPDFAREAGDAARHRLALFRSGQPYREGVVEKPQ